MDVFMLENEIVVDMFISWECNYSSVKLKIGV